MKKLTILLAIILPLSVFSQNISVKSFKEVPNDMTARVTAPITDQNGEKCALIKIITTQTGFVFEGDMLGITKTIQEVGEIWMYVPNKVKKLTIKHQQLGILRNYLYPTTIKEATVYYMELTTAKVTTVVEEIEVPTQWVIITSEPSGANVYINEKHKGITPFQMEMEENDYAYQIEMPLYHSDAGKFNLTAAEGKKQLNFNLRPNFGYANITTTPESGATISVNGQPLQQSSPVKTDKLKSGTYTITAKKNMYHETTKQIIITDGQTSEEKIVLKPAFGNFKITTIPEDNASVLLDGKSTNKTTPCTLEKIISGTHTVTVNKKWYRPITKQFTVSDGQSGNLEIKMPATFGTINITAGDNADIYIDNEFKAKANWKGRLIEGWHTFEAKKEKYRSDKQKIEIFVSKEQQLSLHPTKMQGKLKIVTTPFDATIKLNNKNYGTTPNTIKNLLIGDYTLTLEKASYGTITKKITINEGETTQISETLPAGMQITITSQPTGATLYIDQQNKGTTPKTLTLSFGQHTIKVDNKGTIKEETINIVQNGKSSFKYNVNPNNGSFTDKRDNKTYKWVKIGTQVWMAENLAYKSYSGCWAYDDKQSNVNKYGYLYNWKTAKKVCPDGWHLPTKSEFETLLDNYGGSSAYKANYKALIPKGNSGFSALLGGWRINDGSFYYIGGNGYFWSSSAEDDTHSWYLYVNGYVREADVSSGSKSVGLSVRCLQD